jgi:hypothetical protein
LFWGHGIFGIILWVDGGINALSRDNLGMNDSEFLHNAKEHATLSAGASVERGVGVEATQEHENRAADRGCVSRLVVPSSFVLRGHADEIGNLSLQFMQDLFLSPRMDKYLRTQEGETLREMFPRGLDLVMDRQELRQTTAMPSRAMSQNQEQSSEQRNPDKPNPCG